MERLANTTDYPGKDDLTTALNRIRGYKANGTAQQIIGAPEEAQAAILDYVKSQSASQNNPADFTALVSNPWFVGAEFEPTGEDGNYAVPEEAGDNINSTGWYRGSNTGGDQNAKICQTLPCWNAWNTNFSEISISQDLSGLPNGYYQVSALLITQQDYANQTQHVFAKNDLGTFKSPMLQVGNWDSSDNATGIGEWIRLTTEMALVTDGKLTIGAAGEGKGATNQSGWFCATGFKLYYLGDAGENAVQEMLNAKKDEAQSFAYTMHLAADKAALLEAINATGYKFMGTYAAMTVSAESEYADNFYFWTGTTNTPSRIQSTSTQGNTWIIKPFSAYVDQTGSTSARDMELEFTYEELGGGTTAVRGISIDEINNDKLNEGVFNLNGVKMNNVPTQKGIYFMNGKKVVVK